MTTLPNNLTASLAADSQSLERLKTQAKGNPDQALKAAAQQFETVFLNMMLKSMREATPQDGMFDTEQTKMFTGMLDQQLAQNISSGPGVGLADVMVRQLSRTQSALSPLEQRAQMQLNPLTDNASLASVRAPVKNAALLASAYNGGTQQEFVSKMLPSALQASRSTGVPPQLMLGQAALESGWGKREIRMADGSPSFNVFGIKAGAGWNGKVAEVMTTEYSNGVAHKQVERFRAYDSYAEAFQDHANLISGSPRYAAVMQQGNNVQGLAQAMQQSGYATDPQYGDKLAKVMGTINQIV